MILFSDEFHFFTMIESLIVFILTCYRIFQSFLFTADDDFLLNCNLKQKESTAYKFIFIFIKLLTIS
jgi:hypothetical protein